MVVAATGDDKVNLVVSLLAKTEFAVTRVVARVNRAENEWLFTEQWGVDVAVSKPRLMAALVEEAVTVGDLVRLMTFRQREANLVEITLPPTAPYVGQPVRDVPLPRDAALVAILRGKRVLVPSRTTRWRPATSWSSSVPPRWRTSVRAVILGADSVEHTRRRRRTAVADGGQSAGRRSGAGSAAVTSRAAASGARRTAQTVMASSSSVRRVAEQPAGRCRARCPGRGRGAEDQRLDQPTLTR